VWQLARAADAWRAPHACCCCLCTHRTSQRRAGNVRVLGLQRPLFVVLVGLGALYCLFRSRAWLRLLAALLAGARARACVCRGGGGEGTHGMVVLCPLAE
jgi:hypothetical protein